MKKETKWLTWEYLETDRYNRIGCYGPLAINISFIDQFF